MLKFCSRYVLVSFTRENNREDKKDSSPYKVFASKVKDSTEFRLHIGQMDDFKQMLEAEFITPDMYVTTKHELYVPGSTQCNLNEGWVLRPDQEEAHDFVVESSVDDNHSRQLSMATGSGKAQPLEAPIKVPNGWKMMGDLRLGESIIARDGSTTFVTGIYPKGRLPVYRITFADGRSTECCGDHLWKVHRHDWRGEKWRVIKTSDVVQVLKFNNNKIHIPLVSSEQNQDHELPLDPYVLGIILGDGGIGHGRIVLSTPDEFILNEVRKKLPDTLKMTYLSKYDYTITGHSGRYGSNSYRTILQQLNLFGKLSYQKHIPEIYLHSSHKQRLFLLQGLLDTDGTVDKQGTISFCSTSEDLAKGVQYLVRSLGGIASISRKTPHYTYNGEKRQGRIAYQVNIRHTKPTELFRLPKKKNRLNDDNQYSPTLKLKIVKVEFIGHKECQCISIAHEEKLYVTNDFICTHNTVVALATVSSLKTRTAVLVLPKYCPKWAGDVTKTTTTKAKEVMMIAGSDQLKGVISMAKDGDYKLPFIIISLVTFRNFIKAYEEDPYSIEDIYGCKPEEFWQILGIGNIIIDETHEHLHAVFSTLLYCHVPKVIALSATLISGDPFVRKMQQIMFPREIRFDKIKMKQYIKVYAIAYQFRNLPAARIRTNEFGSNMYSQHAFEKSIIKNKDKSILEGYLRVIDYLIDVGYVSKYMEGDKLAIYAKSIDMCTIITEHIKKTYPKYDTRRYVEQDPYENVIDADIRVSTIQSSGTAIDIPNLRTVIMTDNIASPVANRQALGRLRELKDRDVKFFYIYCEQLRKQKQYHNEKKELFAEHVASIKEFKHPYLI